MELKDKDIIES